MRDEKAWLLEACHELVARTEPPGRLLGLGDAAAFVGMPDGSAVLIADARMGPPTRIHEHFARLVAKNPSHHLKLVVLGGGLEMRDALRRARPRVSFRRAIQTFHLDDEGALWVGPGTRSDSPVGRALTRIGAGEAAAVDREVLAASARESAPSPDELAEHDERRAFVERVQGSRIVVTPILVGVIGLVYGLQWWWGGGTPAPILVRMGANTPAALQGEPWRLLASTVLHGGVLHLVLNGYVLWILGGFVERLLGPARLLAIWTIAGATGAAMSTAIGDADLSVGASGSLWGLLGAIGVLAFRSEGVLPPSVVPAIRRAAIVNLALATAVSFLPRVDLWAHLGGGIAGAAFVFASLHALARSDDSPRTSTSLRTIAAALAIATLVCIGLAFVHGRPWELRRPATLGAWPLAHGVAIEAPYTISRVEEIEEEGRPFWIFGDARFDPVFAIASIGPHDLSSAEVQAQLGDVEAIPVPVPEGAKLQRAWTRIDDAPHPTFEAAWRGEEVEGRAVWQIRPSAVVELEVRWYVDIPNARDTASRMAQSLVHR